MADITLVCPACAKHVTISEYVEAAVPCPECGRMLDRNTPLAVSQRPKLASMSGRSSLISATIKPEQPAPSSITAVQTPSQHRQQGRDQHERRQWIHNILSWVLFLGLLGGLLYWQWKGQTDPQLLGYYKSIRWVLAGGTWIAILVVAFQENWVQGTLNLLIPAYSVYYALNKLDQFYLRAVYFAVLFALGAEFYFLPKETVFHIAQEAIGRWIESIRDLIRNTGNKITKT
jgi:hypothetical protein